MSKRLNFRPRSVADVLRQRDWYVQQFAYEAAARFVEAVNLTADRVLEMPGIGRSERVGSNALAGLRSVAIEGFEEIRLYYLDTHDELKIVRVLHTAREVDGLLEADKGD